MKASRGEIKIYDILKEAGLNFEEEYSFPDLVSHLNHPLRFDFAVFDDNGNIAEYTSYHKCQEEHIHALYRVSMIYRKQHCLYEVCRPERQKLFGGTQEYKAEHQLFEQRPDEYGVYHLARFKFTYPRHIIRVLCCRRGAFSHNSDSGVYEVSAADLHDQSQQ